MKRTRPHLQNGGRDRRRSGDPTLFRRVLCQLSYSTRVIQLALHQGDGFHHLFDNGYTANDGGPDGTRTRDLRLDRPA